jgi:Skp family chaperone for outer membrane proteins
MKTFRLIAASLFLAAIIALPTAAQTRPAAGGASTARPTAAPTAPVNNGPIPESKIALINTDAFDDDKEGITRLVAALKKVNGEFQPRRTELEGMQKRYNDLAKQVEDQASSNLVAPNVLQQKKEEAESLQREIQFKAQGAQADYNKRAQVVVNPILEDVYKSLDGFAKQRGITLMLDAAKIGPAIITLDGAMDVTRAFIAEYNSKNPATASAQ